MYSFKTLTIAVIILGVGINCSETHRVKRFNGKSETLAQKQQQKLKKLFRLHGSHKRLDTSTISHANYQDDDGEPSYHDKDALFQEHQNLNKFIDHPNSSLGAPRISISSNDKVIFKSSFDLTEHQKFSSDGSDEYSGENNFMEENQGYQSRKVRTTRSLATKRKGGPLLPSSLRRINRDPDQDKTASGIINGTVTPAESVEVNGFDDIVSTDSSNDGDNSKSESIHTPNNVGGNSNLATVSESIHTPSTNGGVTKVEINLSFGCLFFCE